jgi:hypothetical protein
VSVYPSGSPNSASGGVLPQPNVGVANLVVVPVGANGKVSLTIDKGTTQVMAAVTGYFGPFGGDLFFPLAPARVFDNQSTSASLSVPGLTGPLLAWTTATLPVAGRGGVPANAHAVALGFSGVNAPAQGFLITWPTGTPPVAISHLNPRAGTGVANTLMSGLGTGGSLGVFYLSFTSVDLLGDAYGYYR